MESNEEEMVSWLRDAAEKGIMEAQYVLGAYELLLPPADEYVRNPHRSPWLKEAAEGGHKLAQHTWGGFLSGQAEDRYDSYQDGLEFLKSAADQGLTKSMYLYAQYMEVEKYGWSAIPNVSFRYYKKVAHDLHLRAYYRIALLHSHDMLVESRREDAYEWWSRGNALAYLS